MLAAAQLLAFSPAPCILRPTNSDSAAIGLRKRYRCSAPLRRPRTSCSLGSHGLPASTAAISCEDTGTKIVLVGCVHGSRVSCNDVKTVLDTTCPDAVILELCEARLNTLRIIMNQKKDSKPAKKPRRRKGTNSFAQASTRFGGAGPAVVATVLEAVYRLQVVSGIDPGIEFTEPIRRYSASTLVCGDARATDTVRELYNVFVAPVKSLKDSMTSVQDLVQRIILPPRGGVNMATIFFKDPARLQELARLMTPALFLAVLVSLVGNAGAAALESAPGVVGLSAWSSAGPLQLAASLFQTLFVTYLIVSTLHFMKVLIADRDRILAKSITETAKRLQTENDAPVTVCAVVGLLHVNGILRLLQEESNVFQD